MFLTRAKHARWKTSFKYQLIAVMTFIDKLFVCKEHVFTLWNINTLAYADIQISENAKSPIKIMNYRGCMRHLGKRKNATHLRN